MDISLPVAVWRENIEKDKFNKSIMLQSTIGNYRHHKNIILKKFFRK